MPRSRMVKPEFWDDEKLATISRDARLTYIGMWCHSDDYGVVKGHPAWLKNKIYPYEFIKDAEFQKWLDELKGILCILPFSAEGEKYYFIRAFNKHQKVNRPSEQRNPQPPSDLLSRDAHEKKVLPPEEQVPGDAQPDNNNGCYIERFLAFWKVYPKKVGKGDAEKAFLKHRPSAELLRAMVEAVKKQQKWEQWQEKNGRFIPNPATWLGQRRWEDEPTEAGGKLQL